MRVLFIELGDVDEKIADCWLTDIQQWAEHAVRNKIRKLVERTLQDQLANENPAWSLESIVPQGAKDVYKNVLSNNISLASGAAVLDPDAPEVQALLAAAQLPTRSERDDMVKQQIGRGR